jgi:phosphoribosylpyrophosphate synthetase
MSLSQIHVLDKIIKKEHRNLRRELKILEIKKQVYNKVQLVVDDIVETYNDIMNRFMYDDKRLAYIRKR